MAEQPPAGQEIRSVSCASATICMAAGNTSGKHGVIEIWDGTAWSALGSIDGDVKEISCASTTACIAVGATAAGTPQSWLVFELGKSWAVLGMPPPLPPGASEGTLNSIDCDASGCTAVGFSKNGATYSTLAERWNGSAWSVQFTPNPLEAGPNVLLGVSCGSENSCVAVGEAAGKPFAEVWDGVIWTTKSAPNPGGAIGAKLASVSCASASSCMAVGDYFESSGNEKTLTETWNGSTWSIVSSPNPSEAKGFVNFIDVSCSSATHCAAVGYYASSVNSGLPLEVKTLAAGWNGASWTIKPSPNVADRPYSVLLGVSCISSSLCTAVGASTQILLSSPEALAERWNGSVWSLQTVVLAVAVNDSAAFTEDDATTSIDVLANDSDAVPGNREIIAKTNGAHGTVAITGGGSGLTYTPDPGSCGADSFTYTLNGGSTATVSVTVTCVDDLPTAVNDSATVLESSGANSVDVLVNDTDTDGGPKTIASKTNGAHGTVAIIGGGAGLTYTPAPGYCGSDGFTYALNGGSTATVSITVTCVDDPPVAVNDSATVGESSGANAISVLANDTDVDGGPKTIQSKTDGAHGTVAITGGGTGLTYTPDPGYCGLDSFTYTLNGGSTATVSITVTCFDDLPTAVNDSATVGESSGANSVDVLANDTDTDGGPKTVESKTNGAHGTVAIVGSGAGVVYTPAPNYCGADSFTYTLNGGSTATVSITVTCVDDPPVAVNDTASLNEGAGATAVPVLANDTDVDGGPKTIESKTDGAHGTVAITGGGTGLTYTPDPGSCGADSFTYTLNGGSTATVSITVACLDDPPTAVNDSDTVLEDSGATAIDVLANDTDTDGGAKSITGKANGSHGAVAIIGAGAGLTYTPDPDYCGPDSFLYTLNGGSSATVSITVTCVAETLPPSGGGGGGQQSSTVVQTPAPSGSSGPVVNITPGVGVVSGRRHPRIAIKGDYAFFTLTCKIKEGDCAGEVTISASVPSVTLGPTVKRLTLVRGHFRIGASRSVLVRAKLTKRGKEVLEAKSTLRGVAGHMGIVDTSNGERGEIDVNLVRRPKAASLGAPGRSTR